MEGMEDITSFFASVLNSNSADDSELNPEGSNSDALDKQKLEIMKKLNFRSREPSFVYKHRRSHEKLDFDITTVISGSRETLIN